MKRKWIFLGITLSYEINGTSYIFIFSRFEGKEKMSLTEVKGYTINEYKDERFTFNLLKINLIRCKKYHGEIAVNKVYYINNVRFTSNCSKRY